MIRNSGLFFDLEKKFYTMEMIPLRIAMHLPLDATLASARMVKGGVGICTLWQLGAK